MDGLPLEAERTATVFVAPRPAVQAQALPRVMSTDAAANRQVFRAVVQAAGLSEREIGARMGIPQQSVSVVLTGKTQRPTLWWLVRFVTACGGRVLIELPR